MMNLIMGNPGAQGHFPFSKYCGNYKCSSYCMSCMEVLNAGPSGAAANVSYEHTSKNTEFEKVDSKIDIQMDKWANYFLKESFFAN